MQHPDDTLLSAIGLATRTLWALRNDDILTVGDVRRHTEIELLRIPNFGRKALKDVVDAVGELPKEPAPSARVASASDWTAPFPKAVSPTEHSMNLEVFAARYIQPPIDKLAAEIRAERAAFQALVEAFIAAQTQGNNAKRKRKQGKKDRLGVGHANGASYAG